MSETALIFSRNKVPRIRPRDYMIHHSVTFTSDLTWHGLKTGASSTRRERGGKWRGIFLLAQTDCQRASAVKGTIKGFIPFRCASLKWVTRHSHCDITVNIHKLIII